MPTASLAVTGEKKVNAKLLGYGLPPVQSIPGLTPLCEIYGKGQNRSPLLVTFAYPFDWVVVTPSNNVNGEDGTIQAGEYAKGDTATLFVNPSMGNVKVSWNYESLVTNGSLYCVPHSKRLIPSLEYRGQRQGLLSKRNHQGNLSERR